MRHLIYALAALALFAATTYARTIVLPVQPVVIDANGAEVPELYVEGVVTGSAWLQSDGILWQIWLDTGTVHTSTAGHYSCLVVGEYAGTSTIPSNGPNYGPVWHSDCATTVPSATMPSTSYATPLHVELR